MLQRESNESVKDYKIRLCKNKELYGITFEDIASLVNKETGEQKGESAYRKWWKAYSEGYSDCQNSKSINNNSSVYNVERVELQKERQKFFDERAAYNKQIRDDARRETLREILAREIAKIEPYKETSTPSVIIGECDILVCLDDIHYGANIDNYWNKYNSDIAKRRLELYLSNIKKIRNIHNIERCYVCCNGDLISGNIHPTIQISNKENVVQQVIGISELLSWFLSELSKDFRKVYLSVVAGNHSRVSTKENSLKDERLDNLIPWYIASRLQNINNFHVIDNNIDSSLAVINIKGLNYLNVHGDYDTFANVSKVIEMIGEKIYCVHFGHLHHNTYDTVDRYKVIRSGSLQGMDDYCIQKRIYGNAEQLVCVCNSSGIVCTYDVNLQNCN